MGSDERPAFLRITSEKRRIGEDAMLIQKAFQYELMPDGTARRALFRFAGAKRYVWNKALFLPKWVGQYQTNPILKSWKQENPWLYEIHSQVLQSAIVDLDVAFKNFFEGRAGRPAPKKKFKCQDSFRYPQGFKVEEGNKRIYLPKIGRVRYRNSRDLRGVAKNVTISRHGDKWFASIETEFEIKEPVHGSASQVGVDLGVFRFATESRGKAIEPLNALKKHATRLRRYQRSMSRKVKFSQNFEEGQSQGS